MRTGKYLDTEKDLDTEKKMDADSESIRDFDTNSEDNGDSVTNDYADQIAASESGTTNENVKDVLPLIHLMRTGECLDTIKDLDTEKKLDSDSENSRDFDTDSEDDEDSEANDYGDPDFIPGIYLQYKKSWLFTWA